LGWCLWLSTMGCGSSGSSEQEAPLPAAQQPAAPNGDAPPREPAMPEMAAPMMAPTQAVDAGAKPVTPGSMPMPMPTASDAQTADEKDAAATTPASTACSARPVSGAAGVRFHHVHFNTVDPNADLEFYDKYLGAKPVDFCTGAGMAEPTRATLTERAYFLYTKVATAPDPRLNTYLEHIGWIHPDPEAELQRLVALGAPRYPVGRAQCESAFAGEMACAGYWFYLLAPSGARIEVALGPGPATGGFGHIHLIMGVDYTFFEKVTGGTFMNKVIDMVNHTDAALAESILDSEMVVETRGKPIDHIGYSTTDLDAEKERIVAAGLTLAEDISFKPEYGFRSFFLKSEKGVWVEMVEDSPFVPTAPP
jgi:catechol 2,3-dioxygenase-like lactoylglutathione lyase family enzyme